MTKFKVTVSDVEIDVVDLGDQWKNSIARHRYPGQSGAELEWLGAEEGEFRLRTVFIGQTALKDYTDLLKILLKGSIVTVEHPVNGQFDAMVESIAAKYDHRIDTAEVDFVIVQNRLGVEISYKPHAVDVAIATTQQAIDLGVCPDIAAPVRPAALPKVDLTDPTWESQINALGLSSKISSYVSKLGAGVGRVGALRAALISPASAAFNALAFAADMPGQVAREVGLFLDVLATGRVKGQPDPVLAAQRLLSELAEFGNLFKGEPLEATMRVLAALQAGRTAATVMADDEDLLRAQVALEGSVTFDSQANRVAVSAKAAPTLATATGGSGLPTMPATPDQVGRLVVAARQMLSDAMVLTSAPQPLAELALALHRQYRDRLLRFETIREIVVLDPTPLHKLCLMHGLPYQTAERLVRLNRMKNPSFTQGRLRIYAA